MNLLLFGLRLGRMRCRLLRRRVPPRVRLVCVLMLLVVLRLLF